MAVLTIDNLSKSFGGIKAVSNINMTVEKGDIVGLIGPNGAGKTTFFNLLTGIYTPTTGKISFQDLHLNNLTPYKITDYGIARTFQNIRLFKNMTVIENVTLGFHKDIKYGLISGFLKLPSFYREEKRIYDEALELLKKFDLENKKDELAKNLPYGEQRRLEIVRALASKPRLLLLDEPAAGMNPNETKELTELIRWIKDNFDITIILIEHDMSLVMNICDKLFVLDYGTLIADGEPEEVKNNERVIEAYLGRSAAC
ncbi:branched-chain amino acid transport system ATP-binding protein [Clostridium tetanomorphum]|uniref:ABC transporter ATP-binding protein n=1 Tax=Clostridium tetanomorphum TaxID=1553 RepID=A0A923EBE7_CLOTT|nr:ABC transporter ATP-binding protein [Clostridium tetanomorphum]KAJ50743.1 ABC transporter-like protein [Clostridium tetanomorphum DSM 665]MBC2399960.1 ABC transporter ATP-binding protein [Clostridium tetanomorphum]MBP1865840.1 branched-chain amino acid transport system ATP-binding protein [Clostridium tetanomorphum]NRS85289.1 branched-chain amino acid transport system ATP-binding protein [Clostridium tetanomorphum]NRZ98466.1 branched-chain amino acid transport system ATP-binding protein [Cl